MKQRGWGNNDIEEAISNPVKIVKTRDRRWASQANKLDDPATAYYHSKGGYVVRNDVTGDIVQISNKNDLGWTAPWEIKNDC